MDDLNLFLNFDWNSTLKELRKERNYGDEKFERRTNEDEVHEEMLINLPLKVK